MNSTNILESPIDLLPVSEDFKEAMHKQDIRTLREIIHTPVTELVNLEWFTNEILAELSELLFQSRKKDHSG